jgi:hypothetical protein
LPVARIINRRDEIAYLAEHLIGRQENVLVSGAFGIGKTCLLRKFREMTAEEHGSSILLIEMEMFSISEDPAQFLSDVLLKLFQETWTSVLNMPFSELLAGLESTRGMQQALLPSIERMLQLYRIVRPTEVVSQYERDSTLGVDKIVKRVVSERTSNDLTRGLLKPMEFIHLTYELLDLLSTHGIQRTIIFGDEANHIDPNIEIEIFRRNFEIFAQRNVQFVFTAQEQLLERVPRLHEAFPALLNLGGFSSEDALHELFRVYLEEAGRVTFSSKAQRYIWQASLGNPREIQRLCQGCTEIAYREGHSTVTEEIVLNACVSLYAFLPR